MLTHISLVHNFYLFCLGVSEQKRLRNAGVGYSVTLRYFKKLISRFIPLFKYPSKAFTATAYIDEDFQNDFFGAKEKKLRNKCFLFFAKKSGFPD